MDTHPLAKIGIHPENWDTHPLAKIGIHQENWGLLYVAILFTGREILDMFPATIGIDFLSARFL
jgi:hypothetical protein